MSSNDKFYITRLIFLHIIGKISSSDSQKLKQWVELSPRNKRLFEKYERGNFISKFSYVEVQEAKNRAFERLSNDIFRYEATRRRRKIYAFVAAACVPLFIALSVILLQEKNEPAQILATTTETEIRLVTSDGETVYLNNNKEGLLVKNNRVVINNKTIVLKSENSIKKNILTVPLGKEHMIVLSDGSKVWLNSGSRLEFPSEFSATQRQVFIEGEAYFEVVKDSSRKFIVSTTMGEVEVLGTTFNVSHYSEMTNIVTTLISGSVRFSNHGQSVVLKPNEQCVSNGDVMDVRQVDVTNYTSWKTGRYIFKELPLDEICRMMSRWFNIELQYGENIIISGSFKRTDSVEEIINMINEASEKAILTIKPN